ncbi:carboxypeptidase-like regulatory domain-containing protein [Flavobacterium amniphilum]|uniref:carboxypeptidase-like regulatory domain-containing protein n=1 Tax=Flavobacterium amniphilum TaxID=1834035 RepID=UPI00202A96C8|nr:carboxypeptidase-like regulatory domain-containing protein [Flavobacterium amniphilum]MCL9804327.1 carboxypeptidase-like regulatory domain-containing protein [Flavobacterium amniphilum]
MRKLQLSIPEPCHENWVKMTPVEKGKFCAACQKNVIDFSKSTDREIINAYQKDKNLCGRFLNTQLDRELIIPKERKSVWLASLFFGMISLFDTKVNAQEKPKTEQTDAKNLNSGKSTTEIKTQNERKTITGIVSDATGPIPGANIIVQGTTRGVQSNFDGTYSINAEEGERLVYSFMGMKEITKTVGKSTVINAVLPDDNSFLTTGLVITGEINEPRKRPYTERAYRVVETWFEY